MQHIDDLTEPPIVGETYRVTCVFGRALIRNLEMWWPVFFPAHKDSEYVPGARWHYHIDPRFCDDLFLDNRKWDLVDKTDHQKVEVKAMKCVRYMPTIGNTYYLFGRKFVEDYKNSTIKCGKCPHKGVSLGSVGTQDGILKCPAHGLPFSPDLKRCILTEEDAVTAESIHNRIVRLLNTSESCNDQTRIQPGATSVHDPR